MATLSEILLPVNKSLRTERPIYTNGIVLGQPFMRETILKLFFKKIKISLLSKAVLGSASFSQTS